MADQFNTRYKILCFVDQTPGNKCMSEVVERFTYRQKTMFYRRCVQLRAFGVRFTTWDAKHTGEVFRFVDFTK